MTPGEFGSLPLHDAVLHGIEVRWEQKICRIQLSAFAAEGQSATPHVLEFAGVTEVLVPHTEPWGTSDRVNSGAAPAPGRFQIEMQSGDVIEIGAGGFSFEPSNKPVQPTRPMGPRG
jgi:hypothetical protein